MRTSTTTGQDRLGRALIGTARVLEAIVLTVSAVVLLGWALGIPSLTRVMSDWPVVTPWTSVGLGALAVSLGLQSLPQARSVTIGRGVGIAVTVLGALILLEYASATTLGLDQWLWGDRVAQYQSEFVGRPSPQTAVLLVALGIVSVLQSDDRTRPVRLWLVMSLLTWVVASVSILGYLFGQASPFFLFGGTGMSLLTALGFALLSLAAAAARPDRPPSTWITRSPNARMIVTALLLLILLPFVFRGAQVLLESWGVTDAGALTGALVITAAAVAAVTVFLGTDYRSGPPAAPTPSSDAGPFATLTAALQPKELHIAVQVDASRRSRNDGFLLRRLAAEQRQDDSSPGSPAGQEPAPAAVLLDPQHLVSAEEARERFLAWQAEGRAPAALDVHVDGLVGVTHALGADTSRYVFRVLLRRLFEASHGESLGCLVSDTRVILLQPSAASWSFRIRRVLTETIVLPNGSVLVSVDAAPTPPAQEASDVT